MTDPAARDADAALLNSALRATGQHHTAGLLEQAARTRAAAEQAAAWERTGPDAWRSADGRIQIVRSTLRTTPRRIDAYEITLDGRDTGCASLTLTSAQRRADGMVAETKREAHPLDAEIAERSLGDPHLLHLTLLRVGLPQTAALVDQAIQQAAKEGYARGEYYTRRDLATADAASQSTDRRRS